MAVEQTPVRIVLVTGYLGAGKTTLLNHILSNDRDLRVAVIVNDIGEVNIDASLIRDGGLAQSDTVVPLTNGCICCELAEDLAEQLVQLADSRNYDYIVIEASGICEPMPIAYTISEFCNQDIEGDEVPMALDNIVAVVDCARMIDEFDGGERLLDDNLEEDDVESLLVEQLEFCTTVVLNKIDLVTPEQVDEVRAIVRSLQRDAVMVESVRGVVPLEEVLDTGRFDFDAVYQSAAWLDLMMHPEQADQQQGHKDDGHDHGHGHESDHEHHHGHHHHSHGAGDGSAELEYGFTSFLYERRKPFDLDKFSTFAANWPNSVIRTKGMVWVDEQPDECFLLEQAGSQRFFTDNGPFVAALPPEEQARVLEENPGVAARWDEECGDRQIMLVFIGRGMEREDIEAKLDACLVG